MSIETDYARIIAELSDRKHLMPGDCITGKVLDQLTTEFMQEIAGRPHQAKLQWLALRAGVSAAVNSELASRRAQFKRAAQVEARVQKARPDTSWMREREAYAKLHSIPVTEVGAHKLKQTVAEVQSHIEQQAAKRAADILSRWTIGNKLLGDVTGAELERQAALEFSKAAGHKRNAQFYAQLANRTPTMHKLRDALAPVEFLEILDGFFANGDLPIEEFEGAA